MLKMIDVYSKGKRIRNARSWTVLLFARVNWSSNSLDYRHKGTVEYFILIANTCSSGDRQRYLEGMGIGET